MPGHSPLRLVRPMLRLSEYSSGLHRSAQGPVPTLSTVAETSAPSVPTQSKPCSLPPPEGWGGSRQDRRLCVRGPAAACG